MYGDGALTALAYAMNTEFGRVLNNEMVKNFESYKSFTIFEIQNIILQKKF